MLDRIDMHIEVPPVPRELLLDGSARGGEGSDEVRARVEAARERQSARGAINAALSGKNAETAARVNTVGRQLLEQAIARLNLSARSYHRILKVARTIADLAGAEAVTPAHLAEAIQHRCLDRGIVN